MKTFLFSVAAFLFLSTTALAHPAASSLQPMQLNDTQMDTVTAGFTFQEEDSSNTSWTQVRVWQAAQEPGGNNIICGKCYIMVNSPALSIGSAFGPLPF